MAVQFSTISTPNKSSSTIPIYSICTLPCPLSPFSPPIILVHRLLCLLHISFMMSRFPVTFCDHTLQLHLLYPQALLQPCHLEVALLKLQSCQGCMYVAGAFQTPQSCQGCMYVAGMLQTLQYLSVYIAGVLLVF